MLWLRCFFGGVDLLFYLILQVDLLTEQNITLFINCCVRGKEQVRVRPLHFANGKFFYAVLRTGLDDPQASQRVGPDQSLKIMTVLFLVLGYRHSHTANSMHSS